MLVGVFLLLQFIRTPVVEAFINHRLPRYNLQQQRFRLANSEKAGPPQGSNKRRNIPISTIPTLQNLKYIQSLRTPWKNIPEWRQTELLSEIQTHFREGSFEESADMMLTLAKIGFRYTNNRKHSEFWKAFVLNLGKPSKLMSEIPHLI